MQRLNTDLARAVLNGELVVHYQPKIAPAVWEHGAYKIEGAEALVRWQHPQQGLLKPLNFISEAEKNGQIGAITRVVVEQVLRQMALWQADGFVVPVSINLAPESLNDPGNNPGLPAVLAGLAERSGILPRHITFELTETAAVERSAPVVKALAQLADQGFVLSLDDFGCGYASFASLSKLPFHEIKIDRSFIIDMNTSKKSEAIARAIISLGHDLGLIVCAEGVERTDVAERLIDMGCDLAQGHLFGRPMGAQAFTALLFSTYAVSPAARRVSGVHHSEGLS